MCDGSIAPYANAHTRTHAKHQPRITHTNTHPHSTTTNKRHTQHTHTHTHTRTYTLTPNHAYHRLGLYQLVQLLLDLHHLLEVPHRDRFLLLSPLLVLRQAMMIAEQSGLPLPLLRYTSGVAAASVSSPARPKSPTPGQVQRSVFGICVRGDRRLRLCCEKHDVAEHIRWCCLGGLD